MTIFIIYLRFASQTEKILQKNFVCAAFAAQVATVNEQQNYNKREITVKVYERHNASAEL